MREWLDPTVRVPECDADLRDIGRVYVDGLPAEDIRGEAQDVLPRRHCPVCGTKLRRCTNGVYCRKLIAGRWQSPCRVAAAYSRRADRQQEKP